MLLAFKKFKGGQFYKEIMKLGNFNNLTIILTKKVE